MNWQEAYRHYVNLPFNDMAYNNPYGFKEPTHVFVNFDYHYEYYWNFKFPFRHKIRHMKVNKDGKFWYIKDGFKTIYGKN